MNKLQWKLHYREQRISSKEEWKPVVGYEGLYEVSSFGRVRSLNYRRHYGKHLISLQYSTKHSSSHGYVRVLLCDNKSQKFATVHRLVATSFLTNTFQHTQVNHINGVKYDNRIENLEWCNASHNISEAYRMGLNSRANPVYQITHTGDKILWRSSMHAANSLGVNASCISSCLSGKGKTAGGFIWELTINTHEK